MKDYFMNFLKTKYYLLLSLTLMLPVALFAAKLVSISVASPESSEITKIPVVFHPQYDISFCGLEKLHPFDSKKYGTVYNFLVNELCKQENCKSFSEIVYLNQKAYKSKVDQMFYRPEIISEEDLLKVHTPEYLKSLENSAVVAQISEIPPLSWLPNFLIQRWLLTPMKYAVAGTVLAAQLALKKGWAINLSGGYHHAKANRGSGFCVYADIPLAIYKLHEKNPNLKVLIVDLDAHQGNGHESICGNDPRVAIYDIYNEDIFPHDLPAAKFITFNYPVYAFINDDQYLAILKNTLPNAIDKFKPSIIIYNAGSDIYEEDRVGKMSVSEKGIIERDEFVFGIAALKNIPIAMVLSGGYTKQGTTIICKSIKNLLVKKGVLTS